jgi:spoIIIJ-associated protein
VKAAGAPPGETERRSAEATGETVAEAKWQALRELERIDPLLDKEAVQFQVLSEGRRGLLGVGYAPARVLASVEVAPARSPRPEEGPAAAHLRDVLEHVVASLGLRCPIEIEETEDAVTARCQGDDLGLLIGRHGQTIDAVQTLAAAIVNRGEEDRKNVVVDAAGYRERRRRTIEALAVRSADEALRGAGRVELEPMSAVERKLVHERLKDYAGVRTVSEGDEPHRRVVVELA